MSRTSVAPNSTKPATRNCSSCPSFFRPAQQASNLGRSIGGPVCGLKLIPLSRPGGPEQKTLDHFAKNCDQFGEETVFNDQAKRAAIAYPVALPDPGIREPEDASREDVKSCVGCDNYVPATTTRKLTGWSAGYCRAKGNLLLDDRLNSYPIGCDSRVRKIGTGNPAPINIALFPEYALTFGQRKKPNPTEFHAANLRTTPAEYPTDMPVTDAHRRMGIRAFRRIQDPKGYGPNIALPIMDESFFSAEDAARIPKSGDKERPEHYFDHQGAAYKIAVMFTKLNQTPALWGEAGVGKTELARYMAWMMGLPFQRISITESSEVDDLVGKMLYTKEKGTHFSYGRLVNAWQRPNVLCLDEPNTGPPAVWQTLRPLTDDSKQMVVDQNNGERIPANKLCYLIMAMNPAWDPRNSGVAPLADADGSRLMHIWMNLPPDNIERQILLETIMDDKGNSWDLVAAEQAIGDLMRMAKDIRAMSEDGTIPVSWGIRSQKKVLRSRKYMSWVDAFRMGVTDSLEPQARDSILEIVRSYTDDED